MPLTASCCMAMQAYGTRAGMSNVIVQTRHVSSEPKQPPVQAVRGLARPLQAVRLTQWPSTPAQCNEIDTLN